MLSEREWNGLLGNVTTKQIRIGGTETKRVTLLMELILKVYFEQPDNLERRTQLAKLLRDTFQIEIGDGSVNS